MKKSKVLRIDDQKLDKILRDHVDEHYSWNRNQLIYMGAYYYRNSKCKDEVSNKLTPRGLIKNEPAFYYSFIEDIYTIMEENDIDHIRYPIPNHIRRKKTSSELGINCERDAQYYFDLTAAYPHIVQYEKMPINGTLYREEDPEKLNFYIIEEGQLKGYMATDDLAHYLESRGSKIKYLFSTDYKVGNKIGEKLLQMSFKNERTKQEAKIDWGTYQKKYLKYMPDEDCYARDKKNVHEPLMIAIISQLCYILLNVRDIIGTDSGKFITDAYLFNGLELDRVTKEFDDKFPNYKYKIIDQHAPQEEWDDKHGKIIYKNYPDIPKAPRSHHKKA